MAKFIVQAMGASFYDCGGHKMVTVAMMAPALAREIVDARNLPALQVEFQRIKATLDAARAPYSLTTRLAHGERAPNGWRQNAFQFRADNDFSDAA